MYANVSPRVHVYAPLGPDLLDYLNRIARFNSRAERLTRWEVEAHASADFLDRMRHERPGNVAIFSGRNRGKIDRITTALEARLHVLADKPIIIRPEDLPALEAALRLAAERRLVLCDMPLRDYRDPDPLASRRPRGVWGPDARERRRAGRGDDQCAPHLQRGRRQTQPSPSLVFRHRGAGRGACRRRDAYGR